jgi:hypothetical protein
VAVKVVVLRPGVMTEVTEVLAVVVVVTVLMGLEVQVAKVKTVVMESLVLQTGDAEVVVGILLMELAERFLRLATAVLELRHLSMDHQ